MDPYVVMISIIPLPFQLKVNIVLTIAIALDRVLALYAPLQYRLIALKRYAVVTLIIAMLFGLSDIVIAFSMSPFARNVNCAAAGCFFSHQFRCYWGISNMVLGLFVIVLTTAVLLRLQQMRMRSRVSSSQTNDFSKYAKASRSSVAFLLSSLVCLTIPSVVVGGAQLFGFSLFDIVGPFYLVGLLCADCMNCIVYALFNSDMRNRLKRLAMKVGINGLTRYVRKNMGNTVTTYTSQMH
ncbi:unnamed protein product [Cylicocyclus nassatus]|uniref:G-protein coupled receptors family 1 profile domain-containing protein n=1 Tax=Cylicocyclus nassatus TaxID=53992 RepID=A0AA36MEY1_CYLNA|nr:unnamed protein product [Cylicocyclus nassatus]